MKSIKSYDIIKWNKASSIETEDSLVIEYSLAIFLNWKPFVTLLCTPRSLKELVVGFLHSEGIITSKDEIKDIKLDEDKGQAFVILENEDAFSYIGDGLFAHKTITTACGKGKTITYNVMDNPEKIEKPTDIDCGKILELCNQFSKNSELFIATGGVHSCALCDRDKIILFEEDIGRHNALDKILGTAKLGKIELEDKIVLTTGRISSEIILKIARRKIPVLVSRSAPTDAAVDMARKLNITLCGFARGQRMNIYTK